MMLSNILFLIKNMYYAYIKKFSILSCITCNIDFSKLDESITITHPIGIVIGHPENIGKNCIIRQNVTIGRRYYNSNEYPVIEDNVEIGACAVILGNVVVGKNAKIGANSTILKDVPGNSTVVGIWK